jgi:NAD(P)H-hydrate epimerase
MRTLEQAAVDAGTPLDALMENAGLAVAQEVWMMLGVVAGRRILVLCGPGNNGGDGLVAARHLAEWEGDVVVYMLAPDAASGAPTKRRDESDANLAKVRALDVPVFIAPALTPDPSPRRGEGSHDEDSGFERLQQALDGAEIVVDALLGIGRIRPIAGALAEILLRLDAARSRTLPPKIVAVDLPTGVDADSGRADPLAVRADMTVTFGLAKVGLYALPGSEHAGSVQVVDIGLPKDAERTMPVELLDARWVRERLPARPKDGNKGTFGRVLVVGGSHDYVGAPRLAAEAAYRVGAGLVTVAATPPVQAITAVALPEATYLPLEETPALKAHHAQTIIDVLPQYDALLIGPGLSQREGVRDAVLELLRAASNTPVVIDADALNALAATDGWHKLIAGEAVLTPHPGEMARLLGCSVEDVQADRLNVAMNAAKEWGHVVVLKGAHTIVAAPDGRAAISPHANPLLASAGTGDVLAGAIAGFIAQGAAPFDAAACAVFVHGLAAEEIGDDLGDRGMLASDLLPALPRAIRTVREGKRARANAPSPFAGMMGPQGLGLGAETQLE